MPTTPDDVRALVAARRAAGLGCQTDVTPVRTDHGPEWACVARFTGPENALVEEKVLRTFADDADASAYHYELVRALNAPEAEQPV